MISKQEDCLVRKDRLCGQATLELPSAGCDPKKFFSLYRSHFVDPQTENDMPISQNYSTISFMISEPKVHRTAPGMVKMLLHETLLSRYASTTVSNHVCNFRKAT